jgi:Ca2+-binding EF-hand superfamily protein
LFDAFKVFDEGALGWINISHLKVGLSSLGIYPSYEHLELFMRRYNISKDGKLRYSEFCDAICPLDGFYASMLNRRGTNKISIKN